MEELFRKIEDNIFGSQESNTPNNLNKDKNDSTKENTNQINKKEKDIFETETKNSHLSKIVLDSPEKEKEENKEEEENDKSDDVFDDDEYLDYGSIDKTGIHFQIISDYNVSIEIVPDELLSDDIKGLIEKYKGVYDKTMKLWVVPYINYENLYKDLYKIEGISYKLHKVGSIAKECFENKDLTKLIIKRKKKEEVIDYTNDDRERKLEQLPKKILKTLYKFQIDGIKFGIDHHCRFLLADEMGVGKTIQAISLAYIYRDSWPVLIVCPGSMKYSWKGEIQTWLGLKEKRINIINSSKQKISSEAYFYIISYDLVKNILKELRKMTFDFVILDEAHSIKNKESLRAKKILPIAVRAKRLILMTGTPLLAKPLEGYPLLYALRPDLFCYFKKYAYRYCDPQPTPFGYNWSGTSNTKELHWILSTLMVRRLKKDVLNSLPPKRRQKVCIKADPNIIEEIKNIKTEIKGKKGTLEFYTLTGKAKIEGACEYISDLLELDQKFIVFAYHYDMLNKIELLMNEKHVEYIRIDGRTKQDKRYDYVNNFQNNEKCKVAILSIVAASTGITLTSASLVIFAELTWTPSIMIQAEDRAHRIGQKNDFVDIKYLYGPETLDDFILDKLQKKLTIVSTTLDDKKEILGVKANPKLINFGEKNSKKLIEEDIGDDLVQDIESIEKKMLNDLDFITDNKRKKSRKKGKSKSKKKHLFSRRSSYSKKSLNINDYNNNVSSSKNKEIRYPKPSKRTHSFTKIKKKIKKESVSELSDFTELLWKCLHRKKAKSVNKYPKSKKGKIIGDEEFSKKTILTLINDNKNIIKEKFDKNDINKTIEDNKKHLEINPIISGKDNINKGNNKGYLIVNLHKVNRRRTIKEEDKYQEKKPSIDILSILKHKNGKENKSLLLPDNKNEIKANENTDENIVQDFKDKIPII